MVVYGFVMPWLRREKAAWLPGACPLPPFGHLPPQAGEGIGDGRLDKSKGEGPVSPVYWKIYGW